MSRKDELLKIASLCRSQANTMSSRATKQAFQKMADIYPQEADLLRGQPATGVTEQNRHTHSIKSAA
jgi:hypothetical protein